MILVDTSVFVYATGEPHPLQPPCLRFVELQRIAPRRSAVTVEVIQEFAHVRARRGTRTEASLLARGYMASFILLSTDGRDLARGLSLFEQHPRLGSFDALLAAVALNRGLEALVSTDRAFGDVAGLRWVDPARPDFAQLLQVL